MTSQISVVFFDTAKMTDVYLLENAALKKRIAELESIIASAGASAGAVPALGTAKPLGLLQAIGDEQLRVQKMGNKKWNNATLASIQSLCSDFSGKVGELFLNEVCRVGGATVIYDGDANIGAEDGTYDVKIQWGGGVAKKNEIKTAWQGKNGGFQHESLRAEGCDQYIFVDIMPECFHVTVLRKFDMKVPHPIIGRKPHLRKGTDDVYKLDFGESNLKKAVDAGISIRVDSTTELGAVVEFLKKFH